MAARFPDLASVRPTDFVGRYSFYDDGWPGMLVLADVDERELRGIYHSYRLNGDYVATALVDEHEPHRIEIAIHDFNGLDRQTFDGYLFTLARNAITGETRWKTEPYSFVGRRSALWTLSPFSADGPAQPSHFAGSYSLYYDGGQGTVHLRSVEDRTLQGVWNPLGQLRDLPVTAEVDPAVDTLIRLRLADGPGDNGGSAVVTGWLFSRPRNVIAGWLDRLGVRRGCYLVRYQ